jgi:hypothetical protein
VEQPSSGTLSQKNEKSTNQIKSLGERKQGVQTFLPEED